MVAATFENTLPLTVGGKEADYRKDENGRVSHQKVEENAIKIGSNIKIPEHSGQNFLDWIKGYNDVATTGSIQTWSNETIEGVNTGGLIGNIANQIIKNKHGLG